MIFTGAAYNLPLHRSGQLVPACAFYYRWDILVGDYFELFLFMHGLLFVLFFDEVCNKRGMSLWYDKISEFILKNIVEYGII
jgi:hypothetical protein